MMDSEREEARFQAWWRASKYCQVISPQHGWERIARDSWFARAQTVVQAPASHKRSIAEQVTRAFEEGIIEGQKNPLGHEAQASALALGSAREALAWLARYKHPRTGAEMVYVSTHYELAVENDENGDPTPLYAECPGDIPESIALSKKLGEDPTRTWPFGGNHHG